MNIPPNLTQIDLLPYAAKLILADISTVISNRGAGHCIKVADLPLSLMVDLCKQLRSSGVQCEAFVLGSYTGSDLYITSTKLVERRNISKSVIIVFIPPNTRTSAEDSFDISTFESFPIRNIYQRLRTQLFADIPISSRSTLDEIIKESGCTSDEDICRFMLATQLSSFDPMFIGLSIFHLGLVPDSTLLNDPGSLRPIISRNSKTVANLSLPDRGILDKIQSIGLTAGDKTNALYQFFINIGTTNPHQWLPMIVQNADLTFDKWEFEEKHSGDVEEILITGLGILERNQDGYPLFDATHTKDLKVTWETLPAPKQCMGLSHFTVELMKEGVAVTDARTIKSGISPSKQRSTTLKEVHKLGLDDGLYYLRVNAWGTGGNLLRSAESESVFFKGGITSEDDDWETDSLPAKVIKVNSIYEAMLRAQVNLRKDDKSIYSRKVELSWVTTEKRIGRRYTDLFTVKYSSANHFSISINAILRRIEDETLADADCLGRWELDLTRRLATDVEPTLQPAEGIDYEIINDFLLARKEIFQLIRNQPEYPGIGFLVETSDLSKWKNQIIQYAEAYNQIISNLRAKISSAVDEERNNIIKFNNQIASIDVVKLNLGDESAYLMLPTHPLKLLWALQFARTTHSWLEYIENIEQEQTTWSSFSDLVPELTSLNVPNVLSSSSEQIFVNVDNFGPFWSIFVPVTKKDSRALVSRVKTLLGSPEADDRFTTVTGLELANKVQRYLFQHPYVITLRINAVQPGSGAILVEMLLVLEHYRPDLRYQLHVFSDDVNIGELGSALDELMVPSEKRQGREELDSFLTASQNSLFPKLVYSKHTMKELLDEPNDFEAHLSILFDVFHVNIEFVPPFENERSNHMHGMLYEYSESFGTSDGEIAWRRQINPQPGLDIDDGVFAHQLMVTLYKQYTSLIGQMHYENDASNVIPTVKLPLGPIDKNLISQVHQSSDWVFTVDRNFGLEYMDSPFDSYCPVYLIDYQPEHLSQVGHRLIISTQNVSEVERIIRPVLERLNLPYGSDETKAITNALRSVSGRLVLKLLSSPQMAYGALGMAFARTFLEQALLLKDMILIPIDAHPDLFMTARQEAEMQGEALSLRRTDLLLVEFEPATVSITFHLIEVKLRNSAGLTDNLSMKNEISAQIENSVQALRRLFDPNLTLPDRFDRLVRTRELSVLLNFYLDRSSRHKLISLEQAEVMKIMLNNLEYGYRLHFTRSGVVFHLGSDGYETEKDGDVVYHYLGIDKVRSLIQASTIAYHSKVAVPSDQSYTTTRGAFTRHPANQGTLIENNVSVEQGVASVAVGDEPPQSNRESTQLVPSLVTEKDFDGEPDKFSCDVILGSKHITPQFGIIGRVSGKSLGLDLNGTNAISLFGVQGSGKSYTLGAILEMAVKPIKNINKLPQPLGAVVFHYSKTEDYRPEYVSMINGNDSSEIDELKAIYNVDPTALEDVLMLVPQGKLAQRKAEFPHLSIHPITFDTSELDIEDWKFLMGVVGNDAMYVKKMNQIIRRTRGNLSLNVLYEGIAGANLSDAQMDLAKTRLEFASEYIKDGSFLNIHIRPGRLIIVDLRDELIEKSEALGLFMVMLKIFSNTRYEGKPFNKMIVFDEAHKYMETAFIDDVVSVVREMRHKGTTVLIASQDPKSVPLPLIELSSMIILHQFSSPEWLKHIQKGVIALQDLSAGRLNMLQKGQAYVWSREATHHEFETKAVKVDIRPRVTKHGGSTVKAVK